jgi:hypothetical protein
LPWIERAKHDIDQKKSGENRTFIKFDLSAISADTAIDLAKLCLWVAKAGFSFDRRSAPKIAKQAGWVFIADPWYYSGAAGPLRVARGKTRPLIQTPAAAR